MALLEINLLGDKAIAAKLRTLGKQGFGVITRVLRTRLRDAVAYARQKHLSGGSATTLYPRSGDLRNAFWYEVLPGQGEVTARLGFIRGPSGGGARRTSPLRYAWTHERGATIKPGPGKKFLRIPAPFALTAAGRLKAKYNVVDARQIPNTRIIRSRSGNLAIWEIFPRARRVKGQPLSAIGQPLFWLARSVTVPARPTLGPTWERFRPIVIHDIRQ
ncbi:MAG: hypothetical protein U1A73_06985, partial [Pseudomonas sp.]|nr:hypothetical protein [Pseudomonas sp.]